MASKSQKTTGKQRRGKGSGRGGNNPQNLIGKGFESRPENINKKGRPRKLINQFIADGKAIGLSGLTETQVISSMETLLQLSMSEVERLANDKSQPAIVNLAASVLIEKGTRLSAMNTVLDRAYGKAMMRASMDATINAEQPLFGESDIGKKREG